MSWGRGGPWNSRCDPACLPLPAQVILVLTTFQVPLVIMSFGQSKLYRR